jgi:hypothetical protein
MTEEALARAESQVEAGDLDGARATAEAIIAGDALHAGAHNVLGFIAHREGRLADALAEFALAGDDPDARANIEAVEAELRRDSPPPQLTFALEDIRRGALGPVLSPALLGQLLGRGLPGELEGRVTQLPSAASANERRFLLRFAETFWDGEGDVFENGPLLGGTTRGLALGMLANPRRRSGALLHTFDWFAADEGDLPPVWDQLIAAGMITRADYKEMQRSGSFQKVFDKIHSGHDYSPILRTHEAYLPGHRDEAAPGRKFFELPEGRVFNIVFVDGCKSWYGTKYWAVRMCESVRPGCHFVFQDYGWYTCFWLPVFVSLLADHFRLVTFVDDTYAFELIRPLEREIVERRFPDEPTDVDRDTYDDIFTRLGVDAGARSDVHAMVSLTIQHAGAMAYLGHKDEAREHISAMLGRPEFFNFRRRMIERALISPTYTPEGPVAL